MRRGLAVLVACGPAAAGATAVAQEAEIARHKHLGVAACAASVCHGKVAPEPGRNVGLNEYRTWSQEDVHARAYLTLEKPASKRIAANLGLGNPAAEPICLDCHTDNVPAERRGPKFQVRDGIGCEACHGGAEKWVESHAEASRTHRENVAQGLYPSEQPLPRARLCLSCHLGTKDKFATHFIMAAGHPRLSFELEAYTANQPAHFTVDADYRRRKGTIDAMNLWLTGQIESARALLTLQRSLVLRPAGMFPELALYDCHGCHHPMDPQRWTKQRPGEGIKPGTLRLQTQNLAVLAAALEALEPAVCAELAALTDALVKAGQRDVESVNAAAGALLEWLDGREALSRRQFSRAEVLDVRKMLLRHAASDKVGDYAVAEQIVLAVESLSYSLGDRNAKKVSLDKLYATVKSGTSFNASQFSAAAKAALDRF